MTIGGPASLDARGLEPFEIDGPAGALTGWTSGERDDGHDPILFVHPINSRGAVWSDVVRRLAPARHCVMPDLRGHGGSGAEGPYGMDHWAEDCVAVLDTFGLRRAHVIGGSLGGPIACALAASDPARISSITAFGSALRFAADLAEPIAALDELGVEGMFRKYFPLLTFGPHCDPAIIERGISLANPNDKPTVAAIWAATISTDAREVAERVRCPALVVTGAHDVTCPPAAGLELAAALRTELVLIPGIGHFPMLELPDTAARLVCDFLGRVDP